MGSWLRHLWDDEEFFCHSLNSVTRLGMIGIGWLFENGVLPTGVSAGGKKLGPLLILLSAVAGRVRPPTAVEPKP